MSDDLTQAPDWTRIRSQAELHRRNEENSFRLAEYIERSALNVIGAYQNVVDRVQWLKFHQAGPGAVLNERDKDKLPKVLREIAERASIAWPHDEFCSLLATVKQVRNKLAHMSWIHSIEGEFPDRVLTVVIAEQPEWVEDRWSKQPFRREEIRESEIGEAMGALDDAQFIMALIG